MKITCPFFNHNSSIPSKYTCDGVDLNPSLKFADIPAAAKSLVLIVDDPDAPAGDWSHWIVYNIASSQTEIAENSVPEGAELGLNDFGRTTWGGPCPPSGEHHYHFKLYALDTILKFSRPPKKTQLEQAMEGHILKQAELIGHYKRK